MSDRRNFDAHRAMKRGFSGHYVKASLRRALRAPAAPWPDLTTPKHNEPAKAIAGGRRSARQAWRGVAPKGNAG